MAALDDDRRALQTLATSADTSNMDIAQRVIGALIVAFGLGLVVWLAYRLLRWARSGTGGAHALGAVLTEVTQTPAVHEAKQGKKLGEREAGDPPDGERT